MQQLLKASKYLSQQLAVNKKKCCVTLLIACNGGIELSMPWSFFLFEDNVELWGTSVVI